MNPLLSRDPRLPDGLGATLPIPLNAQQAIDFPALEGLLKRMEPVDFIRLVNSEIGVRDGKAYAGMVSFIREVLPKPTKIIESLPSTETRDVVRYCASRAEATRDLPLPDAWLVRPPVSRDVTLAGVIAHLRSVAESTECPVVAVMTGLTLEGRSRRQLVEAIADHPNIAGMMLTGAQALTWPRHKSLRVWVTGDTAILPMFAMGCDAVISQLAVAFPKKLKQIAEAARFGAWAESRMALEPLFHLIQHLEELPSPAGIKTILSHLSHCEPHLRLPHTGLAASERDALYADLAKLELNQTATEPR